MNPSYAAMRQCDAGKVLGRVQKNCLAHCYIDGSAHLEEFRSKSEQTARFPSLRTGSPRPSADGLRGLTTCSRFSISCQVGLEGRSLAIISGRLISMEGFLQSRIRSYYEVELPPRLERKRWPLLIALHGYQGDKDSMMRLARRVAQGKMVVISLEGPYRLFVRYGTNDLTQPQRYRVGFGWGTSYKMEESIGLHHQNVRALIDLGVKEFRADRTRVLLLGFSQACAYNYRFVFTHARAIRGVVGVCGGVPIDWEKNPRYRAAQTDVLHIAATDDEFYSHEKNLEFRNQLARRARSLDFRFYHSPHKFPRAAIPHIRRWINAILERA